MWRYIIIAIPIVGFAVKGPDLMQSYLANRNTANNVRGPQNFVPLRVGKEVIEQNDDRNPSSYSSRKPKRRSYSGRTASARMHQNGQFYFDTKMNGTPVKVMVDTGSSGVAINQSTARRLGIQVSNSDFKFKSQTANGITYYARAVIDEIKIGRIVVNNVQAAVLKDSSLSDTLLGMTFLRKLRKYEVNGDKLILTQ